MDASLRFTPFVVLLLVTLGADQVQAEAVCPDPPGTPIDANDRIECTEDNTSTNDIEIDAVDVNIDTSPDREPGVHAKHEGAGDIDIEVQSDTTSTIDTAGTDAHGIHGEHTGTGDVIINVQKTEITTTGDSSHGVYATHTGDGNIDIDVIAGSNIDIQGGGNEYAIRAQLDGDGNIVVLMDDTTTNNTIRIVHRGVGASTIRVTNSTITSDQYNGIINQHSHVSNDPPKDGRTDSNTYVTDTDITLSGDHTGTNVFGAVYGEVSSNSTEGDVLVDVEGAKIVTTGAVAFGVRGRNLADVGDVRVNVRDSTVESTLVGIRAERNVGGRGAVNVDVRESFVTVTGSDGYGIHTANGSENATADDVQEIFVENSTITTKGIRGHGIFHNRQSVGDLVIETRNVDIVTESTERSNDVFNDTYALGIFARHDISALAGIPIEEGGDIEVDIQGGSIETRGAYSYGIRADIKAGNGGGISITTGDGNTITTTGESGHGIVTYHYGTDQPTSNITIVVGGSIDVSGAGAQGVRVGRVNASEPDRVAPIGTDGYRSYRKQTVTVNGTVTSAAEGVYLAGGGKVFIGPMGMIRSESGIAILATGDTPGANDGELIKPKLLVDMNLDGRDVVEVIGNNWIINDEGETTIVVNGVELHDGEKGVTGNTAYNGAWNVTMREHGFKVVNRAAPDPANWRFTESTDVAPIILGRDFAAGDFTETRRPTPPPPVPPVPELSVFMAEEPIIGGADDVAGIHVEGDGMVHIGPMGSIRAESGIAILATQDTSATLSNSSLGGVELRSTGAVSGIAALTTGDGPKLTVDMDLDGRRVQDVIGDDWIINDGGETTIIINGVTLHEGATGIVTDAVAPNGPFNVAMIDEGVMVTDRTDPDPANWMISDPALGIIADRDFSAEDFLYLSTSGSPLFVEEYAPRSAVYESLPGFLLRLRSHGPTTERLISSESPVWMAFSGGSGSVDPSRSTTGAEYDYDRSMMQFGKNLSFGEGLEGWFAVHYTQGDSEVSSPTGGGDIDVNGVGATLDIQWQHASGYYLGGHTSFTAYDVDLSSDDVGRLRSSVDALGHLAWF